MQRDSFLRNCQVMCREADAPIFVQAEDGRIVARLDGYVIVPKERLAELAGSIGVDADKPSLPI
jgi:hypothetical protein